MDYSSRTNDCVEGLTLVLDAHTDLLADSSIEDDSAGFLVGLTKAEEFPLMGQGTHLLRPGTEHFLSIDAMDTISDSSVKEFLSPEQRNCLFGEEREVTFFLSTSFKIICIF